MLFLLFLLFTVIAAFENEDCDQIIRIKKREVKRLLSPNHPNQAPPRSSCRWTVVADVNRRIVLVCPFNQTLDIHAPDYEETCNRQFTISPDGGEDTHHCQERGFYEIGFSYRMVITYQNELIEPVDSFTCYVYAEWVRRWDLLENHSGYRRSVSSQRQLPKPKSWDLDPTGIELTLNLGKNDMRTLIPPSHPENEKGWSKRSWFIRAEFSSQITVACHYTDKPPEPLTVQVVPCFGQFTVLTKKNNATYHCNERAFTHYSYSYQPNVSMIVKYENLERQSSDDFLCFVYSEGRSSSTKEIDSPYKQCDHSFNLTGLEVGVIKSPNYPNKTSPGAQCRWAVTTPENSQILIQCTEPQVHQSKDCVDHFDLETATGVDKQSCPDAQYLRLTTHNWAVITYSNSYDHFTAPFSCQAHVIQNETVWDDTASVDRPFRNPTCDHAIALRPRVMQEFHYPIKKNESEHPACRWIVVAPPEYRIVFVCYIPNEKISKLLPCRSVITISTEDRNDTHHCIGRTFSRTLISNRMAMFYPEGYQHPSSFLTCHFYAEEKLPRDEETNLTLHYAAANEKCDKSIILTTNDDNELFSPNYPNDEPPGTACRWIVTAPSPSRIILSCLFVNKPLAKGETCKTYLTVSTEGQLNTTYCTNESFQRTSVNGWMAITYENLSPNPVKSFDCGLFSELESPSNECENCSDTRFLPFADCDIIIPMTYHDSQEVKLNVKKDKPGTSCRWTIVAPEDTRILLSCPNNNETEASACNSQFTIATPGNETRFCRNKNFAKYSVSYWMIITYKNPSVDTLSPFKCFVYTEKKLQPDECGPDCSVHEKIDYTRCDENINLNNTGQFEALRTPDFPNDIQPGMHCRWRVHSPNFTVVSLYCSGNGVEGSNACQSYLAVYRAGLDEDPVIFCHGVPFDTNSTGDEMIITYGNQNGLSRKPFVCYVTPVYEKCREFWQFPQLPYNTFYNIITPHWDSPVPPWDSCSLSIQTPPKTQIYLICGVIAKANDTMLISTTADEKLTDAIVRPLNTSFMEVSVKNKMTLQLNIRNTTERYRPTGCQVFVDKEEQFEECNCGNKFKKGVTSSSPKTGRIFQGEETLPNEFPMVAALVLVFHKFCAATIISDRYALTAAHCINLPAPVQLLVKLAVGTHDLSKNDYSMLRVVFFRPHPKFDESSKHKNHDIGIVGVEKPMHFNEKIQPVCLPFKIPHIGFGDKVIQLGWGLIRDRELIDYFPYSTLAYSAPTSNVLLKIDDGIVLPDSMCGIAETSMCIENMNRTTCFGDSGGPVLWKDKKTGLFKIVGVHSLGFSPYCYVPPGFTRKNVQAEVIHYLDWIQEQIPDVKFCKIE